MVVVGGSAGKTGGRVVRRLRARGVPVRPVSRSSSVPFDWHIPAGWDSALDGAQSAYITYQPDLAFPGAADRIGALAEVLRRQGIQRVVLLAGRGEAGAIASEQALLSAIPSATVLRSAFFNQNFTEGALHGPVLDGLIALPAARGVTEPFLDADDIADAAVATLSAHGHEGAIYELTGPQSISFDEVATELSAATGRPVSFVAVTPDEFTTGAVEAGLPAEDAHQYTALFSDVLDGRNAHPADGVALLLGREPVAFADFVRAAAAAGSWNPPVGTP